MAIVSGVFGYIVFIIVGLLCVSFSKRIMRSYVNITTMLCFPYLLICSFQIIIAAIYPKVVFPCIEYWSILIFFFILTLVAESVLSSFLGIKVDGRQIVSRYSYKWEKVFHIVIAFYLLYVIYDTYVQVRSVDITMLLQDEFEDEYGGSGGFYSRVFLMICSAYYLGYVNKWYGYLFGLLCLIPSLVVNTKGVIFIPILSAFFIKTYLHELSNTKQKIIVVGIIGIVIFFGSYMWQFYTWGENPLENKDRWQEIFDKLVGYLISGVQEFNLNIVSPLDDVFKQSVNITITPFNNLLAKFGFGESISSINEISRPIGLNTSVDSSPNVNSYIGTLYLFNGFGGACFLHLFWISITVIIKKIAIQTNNPFIITCYCLLLSGYALGWFDFYFMQTFWIYLIIFCFILYFCFNTKKKAIWNIA